MAVRILLDGVQIALRPVSAGRYVLLSKPAIGLAHFRIGSESSPSEVWLSPHRHRLCIFRLARHGFERKKRSFEVTAGCIAKRLHVVITETELPLWSTTAFRLQRGRIIRSLIHESV